MWGAKPNLDPEFSKFVIDNLIEASRNINVEKTTDQVLLARYLYPYINGKVKYLEKLMLINSNLQNFSIANFTDCVLVAFKLKFSEQIQSFRKDLGT